MDELLWAYQHGIGNPESAIDVKKRAGLNIADLIVSEMAQHLEHEGYITWSPHKINGVEQSVRHYFHKNLRGLFFLWDGGFTKRFNDERKKARLIAATTAARIAETITLILIASFTAYLQFDDSEKDERIIQLERKNTILEEKNADLQKVILQKY